MAQYSHSKLSTFEQCPLKFKFRYIDKIKPEIEKTIEAHLGSAVHETLEHLYKQVQKQKIPSIDELIIYYTKKWKESFNEEVYIKDKSLTEKDYFNKGVQFIIDYYIKNQPFQENTIDIEKKISLIIDKEKNHKLIGYIDRLVHDKEKDIYEIHDYKTANNLPTKEKIDNDRQLAIYSLAIKELFGMEKKVCLTWHYLAHNKKICSERTNEQLQNLKQEIKKLIEKIEQTKEFPGIVTKLCDWCEYKPICPKFNSQNTDNSKTENPLNNNSSNKKDFKKYPTILKYLKD